MDDENSGITQHEPSTDANSMPKGGGPFQRGKKASVKIKNGIKDGIGRAINELWKRLTIKQKLIVVAIIVIIVIIILAAALLMSMISETTNVASDNVDKFIASYDKLDKESKELFDDKSSLILLKLSDVNNIYKQFVADNKGGSETQTLMQYEIGNNDVKETDIDKRIINIDDKLPLYKHILMTEKYNFNLIKWQKFSHNNNTAGDLKVKFVEDKEKGLKYPDDTKFEDGSTNPSPMKLEKFIDLTLPYLQTWYIPLAMSNASIVSGTEKDSSRSPQFSYNIIKEAYSNVVVNWYELKEHTLNTKYYTYDKVKKHDNLYGLEVIKRTYGDGSVQYSYRTNHLSKVSVEDERISYDTSTDSGLAGGNKNPMKEEYVGESDKYKSTFYLKEADTFDAKIINNFNYKVFLESDVKNRTNANSMSSSESPYAISADNINNRADAALERINVGQDGTVSIGYADYTPELVSSYVEDDPTRSTENITVYNINVKLGDYYEYENEKQHNVTRVWKDTLDQTKSETSDYTIDDLLIYNQSKDRKETVTGSQLCGDNYSSSVISGSGNGDMAKEAISLVEKLGNHKVEYESPRDAGNGFSSDCYVCSTFVSEVIYNVTNHRLNFSDTNNVEEQGKAFYNNKEDFDLIYYRTGVTGSSPDFSGAVNMNKQLTEILQPGDIVGTYSDSATFQHIMIYIGDGKYANMSDPDSDVCIQERGYDCSIKYVFRLKSSNTENNSTSTNKTNNSNNTNTKSNNKTNEDAKKEIKDMKTNTTKATYKSTIAPSQPSITGYESTYTSGTTGRMFREYKQNIDGWDSKFPISHLPATNKGWTGECGTVSIIILGSGYSEKANFADITKKMEESGGGTQIEPWIKDYTGQSITWNHSYSPNDIINKLSNGCVAMLHSTSSLVSSSGTHYMAILDISEDKSKVYLSNPWMGSDYQGWITFDQLSNIFESIAFLSNDGSIVTYSDDGTSASGSDSTCTGTESGKYYTQLKKTDGLNRIDFMNSNPEIFHRYIREGGEYLKYVGYARAKLNLSYWNLKNTFNKVYEKHGGSLPWAYGKTLGFDNIYGASKGAKKTNGGGRFTWPVPEYVQAGAKMWDQITSTFGNRTHPKTGQPGTMHNGIDIAHATTPDAKIVAAAGGTVMKASDSGDGYGNCVIIQHSDNYYTLYGHMAPGSLLVKVGDKVNAGQQIGTMGTTGVSTGNHLHFEVTKIEGEFSMSAYYSSTRLDPCDFFNEDCSPIGGGASVGDNLTDYIWGWEGGSIEFLRECGYLVDNDQNFVIFIDTWNHTTRAVGIGLDLDAGGFAADFERMGYSTAVGAKLPREAVEKVFNEFVSSRSEEIISKTSGLNLKQCQIDALVSRSYHLGFEGAYYYNGMSFNEAYQKWWKDSDFGTEVNYNHPLYTNFMFQLAGDFADRRESEWKLFQTGVYDRSFFNN